MATNKNLIIDNDSWDISDFTRRIAGKLLPYIHHHQEVKNASND